MIFPEEYGYFILFKIYTSMKFHKNSHNILCFLTYKQYICIVLKNNVEALRYYPTLKSGQFHRTG